MDMCFNAFAGGYTHVNRWFKDEIIKPKKGQTGKHGDFRTGYLHVPTLLQKAPAIGLPLCPQGKNVHFLPFSLGEK